VSYHPSRKECDMGGKTSKLEKNPEEEIGVKNEVMITEKDKAILDLKVRQLMAISLSLSLSLIPSRSPI
jgi:hypothetical protein